MTDAAQQGNTVKVHYTGKLEDGTVFDSSQGRDPLEFTLGEGKIIPGFEKMVEGMTPGDSKEAHIPSDEAYGDRRDDMMLEVSREQIPAEIEVEVGQQLQVRQQDGQTMPVTVTDIGESSVKLDANHPLAGKDLLFEVELVEIVG